MSDYEKRVHEALEWAASFEDTSAATSRSERLHIALAIPHASFILERVTFGSASRHEERWKL